MYYSPEYKLAFVMPPRTGTTMLSSFLKQQNLPFIGVNRHIKPADFNIDGADQYKFCGFYRNPLDRFLSLLRHLQQQSNPALLKIAGTDANGFKSLDYDQLLELFPQFQKIFSAYFSPQIDWLVNAETLDFNNYVPEFLRVARMLNVSKVYVAIMNDTEKPDVAPSQKVIDYVQSYYADDYRLGRERGLLT